MKKKNSCLLCGSEQCEAICGLSFCKNCEQNLLNALQKRNTPKCIKSVFLRDL